MSSDEADVCGNWHPVGRVVRQSGPLIKSPPLQRSTEPSLKAWKRRWFVLFEGSSSLLYFKDEATFLAGFQPKGSVDLSLCKGVKVDTGNRKYSFLFCVSTVKRNFFLSAATGEAMRVWMGLIRHIVGGDVRAAPLYGNVLSPLSPSLPEAPSNPELVGALLGDAGPEAVYSTVAAHSGLGSQSRTERVLPYGNVTGSCMEPAASPAVTPTDHANKAWFLGSLDREAAEAALQARAAAGEAGVFLVRQSTTTGSFVLSWLNDNTVYHTRIDRLPDGLYQFDVPNGPGAFPSVTALVECAGFQRMLQRAAAASLRRKSKRGRAAAGEATVLQSSISPAPAATVAIMQPAIHAPMDDSAILSSKVWFHRSLSRHDAEAVLCAQAAGGGANFLVRQSATTGAFVVSWWQNSAVFHTPIVEQNRSFKFDVETSAGAYPSLVALIESDEFQNMSTKAELAALRPSVRANHAAARAAAIDAPQCVTDPSADMGAVRCLSVPPLAAPSMTAPSMTVRDGVRDGAREGGSPHAFDDDLAAQALPIVDYVFDLAQLRDRLNTTTEYELVLDDVW